MSAQTTDEGRHQHQQQQQSPLKTELGTTTIQDSVVSKVAGIAAQEVEGIRMGSGTTQAVGSTMSVEYGRTIHHIAETVRANVIRRVEHLVGLSVTEVNITVNDIFFPQQEQQQEQ